MSFSVYPAIDLRGGRVVRLRQGDFDRAQYYPRDPVELAARYAAAGAHWLHVVDLDAAKGEANGNAAVIAAIAAASGLRVQCGGGVRRLDDVARLRDLGVTRVVVGSLALKDPAAVVGALERHGASALCLALDVRADPDGVYRVHIHGWQEATGAELFGTLDQYLADGLEHLLCTDIERDGMMVGPNLALYRRLVERAPGLAVQASGGIRDGADLAALRAIGCGGAVIGKALLDGRLSLAEALAC